MGASVSQSTPSLPAWSELEKHLTRLQLLLFPGAAGPAALDKGWIVGPRSSQLGLAPVGHPSCRRPGESLAVCPHPPAPSESETVGVPGWRWCAARVNLTPVGSRMLPACPACSRWFYTGNNLSSCSAWALSKPCQEPGAWHGFEEGRQWGVLSPPWAPGAGLPRSRLRPRKAPAGQGWVLQVQVGASCNPSLID